jgi:rRNA maturation endonuclease Nob1
LMINMVFKYCKRCVGIRQFLPNGYDSPRHCDICGSDE